MSLKDPNTRQALEAMLRVADASLHASIPVVKRLPKPYAHPGVFLRITGVWDGNPLNAGTGALIVPASCRVTDCGQLVTAIQAGPVEIGLERVLYACSDLRKMVPVRPFSPTGDSFIAANFSV